MNTILALEVRVATAEEVAVSHRIHDLATYIGHASDT